MRNYINEYMARCGQNLINQSVRTADEDDRHLVHHTHKAGRISTRLTAQIRNH